MSYVYVQPYPPNAEDFTPAFCRRQRRRWSMHRKHLAARAGVAAHRLAEWEDGKWKKAPGFFVAKVHRALRLEIIKFAAETIIRYREVGEITDAAS